MSEERCAACDAAELQVHLAVAGSAGPEGLAPTTSRYGTALADVARCPRCGHMQLSPMPASHELAVAYAQAADDAYLAEERGQRATACAALELIERHAQAPATGRRLLDLGCWLGFLLDEARARGWETVGVEPSAFAARHARERLGLEVIEAGLMEAPLPERSFHAITLGDVIEHLPDPAAALRRIRSLLVPGGVLWLALPDAGSRLARALGARWWSVLPTHVQYFTRNSLALLLAREGFDVLELTTAPKVFTVAYYLRRLAGYSPPLATALVKAADAAGLAERLVAPDLRDRMQVVARRRG